MECNHRLIQRDTGAWRMQVWISFATAVTACGSGLAWLPGTDLDRAFMVMGYLFCLLTAFVLSKYIRDKSAVHTHTDTPLWGLVVWGGFCMAMGLTAWGLWRMDINPTWKSYLVVGWLYLISSAFTLAKTLRDAYDADQFEKAESQDGMAANTTSHTPAAKQAFSSH